jgi:glutamate dehydrogenase/leucine dehydrogenase
LAKSSFGEGVCNLQCPQDDQYNRAMLAHQRIALIGAGNMAEAILAGLLHGGQFTASDIRKDIKVVRKQKGMKPEALLGDQTFDHQLT